MYYWLTFFCSICAVCTFACRKPAPRQVTPAFYYWQTSFETTPKTNTYLDSFACKKLYIKFLDIGNTSGTIEPLARLDIRDTSDLQQWNIVPAIFITNAVFKNISPKQTEWLVQKIAESLAASPLYAAQEIQFDCDWTASTHEAFFLFLKKMKAAWPDKILSATIRLHQYKFPGQTGVPPVSRGMLMFYNTGDIESEATENSIIQIQDAQKYVQGAGAKYPLPLDVALPVFSWTLVFREGTFWKIIQGVPADMSDTTRFENTRPDQTRFQVKKGTFLSGHYLRPGDHLRVETVSPELLLATAELAAKTDLARDATVAFFQLDTATTQRYPPKLMQEVCQKIRFPGH